MTSLVCYKCHQLGHWAALCPQDLRASRSSIKPSLTMFQQDWSGPLQPACPSQIIITGLEPRVQLDVAGRYENFLVDTGATYFVLLLWSLLLPNLYYLGCYRKNNHTKIHPNTSLLLGWTNIFPPVSGGPWVSYTLIGKRSFPAFKILQLLHFW